MMILLVYKTGVLYKEKDGFTFTSFSRIGAIFFAIINAAFMNIPTIEVFQKERPIFM